MKHYPIQDVLFALGIKSQFKQFLFLLLHRKDLDTIDLEYGINEERIAKIIHEMPRIERSFFKIKVKKGF